MKNIDLGIVIALVLLVGWAVLTFVVNDAPGVTHALLIAGLTTLFWRVVKRDAAPGPGQPRQR